MTRMMMCGVYRRQGDGVCGRVVRDQCGYWLEVSNARVRFVESKIAWAECGRPELGESEFEWCGREIMIERTRGERMEWRWIPPISRDTEPDLYDTDVSLESLERRGLCVVGQALSQRQVWAATQGCEAWLEKFGNPIEGFVGVVRCAGQCPGSWLVRGNRRVQRCFETVWNCTDLITSMDALFVWYPWQLVDERIRTMGGWLHTDDHEPIKSGGGRCTVQGLVSLTRATQDTGGFVCCLYDDASQWRYVALEKGDLVLWDSKLFHASEPGCDCSNFEQRSLLRLAVPVCMVPRAAADPESLLKRKQLCIDGGTTKHSPHKCLSSDDVHHAGNAALSSFAPPQGQQQQHRRDNQTIIDHMHPDMLRVL